MRILSQLSRRSARRKGLTLVEILVVSAIFVIIMTSLLFVFKAGLQSWRRAQAHLDIYQNARAAIDMITRDLKAAYINPNNGAITFQGYAGGATGWVTPTDPADTEVFFIAALNPVLNNPNATSELCQVAYWRNNATNSLMRYYFEQTAAPLVYGNFTLGASQKVADNVSRFRLEYFGVDAVTGAPVGPLATWNSTTPVLPNQWLQKPRKVEITLVILEPSSGKTQTFTTGVYIPQ